ncbi:RNA polymerase sigma factor [Planctellipticum variicoloris]|uniref:RNA polymerase sigma factor n=1 Tax=Planctellipticum variicoloris TaxID=3064265 RepID=UPI003013FDC1|nr:sigma-70 family RNA polymerase sigma factor [Planctomycetaceae bacterium SH412]
MSDSDEKLNRAQEYLWVLRARQGDRQAFQLLVEKYDRRLLYFVRRFERDSDRASDLVQDIWLTVFCKIGRLELPEAFRTWLYRIAHAKAVATIRRDMRRVPKESSHDSKVATGDAGASCRLDDADLVHRALERLSSDHREILVLRFLEQMTLEEISDVLACPSGTVKSRLHYAKEAMRRAVEEFENG